MNGVPLAVHQSSRRIDSRKLVSITRSPSVAVVYEMALSRGMVPPRLPLVRTALYAAALAAALVLLMYILLRTVNFMH